ncbi:Rho GTPase activation protein [Penicillium expansum]|nr:Rho GTPase activation protein [Penicillium expansum]
MRRLKNVFRSGSETTNPASSRAVWQRRRQGSEGEPLKPQPEAASSELQRDEQTTEAGPSTANKLSSSAAAAPVDNTETGSNVQHAQDTGELPSRSKNGTRRLKRMVACIRGSLSQDDDPITGTQPQTTQESAREGRTSSIPLSSNPIELDTAEGPSTTAGKSVRFNDPKERRKTSGQTTHSQDSSQTEDTICRDPAQRINMPFQEEPLEEWGWPGLMLYCPESSSNTKTHIQESSDPFSDGKAADVRQAKPGPSRRSAGTSREESSRASEGTLEPIAETDFDTIEPVIEPAEPDHADSQRASSANSQTSRVSWSSTLDAPKAISAFNRMASQFGIPIAIPDDDTPSPPAEGNPAAEEQGPSRRGFGLLGKVRKVRSSLDANTTPLAPPPKLRRMKTFANLRRPTPMTSLQGRSIETLARLGGYGYLMLKDLGPCPVQLPAYIVATLMFLHKYGLDTPEIFIQSGDLKTAIRLYDHFASQVLEVEKDESKISLTMRVVAMPQLREDSAPVLSVAWALKAVLAGLPNGILGSVRLYQVLREMYYHSIPNQSHQLRVPDCISDASPMTAARVQLMCLALIALAPEMQRDLICAVFGLLSLLANAETNVQDQPGMELRDPVASPNFHELVRVFGPLLLGPRGQEDREGASTEVEKEIDDQRVAVTTLDKSTLLYLDMSTNLKSAMPSGLPSGLSSGLPPGLGNNINIDPSPFTTSFSGDFLGLPIPDDDQLWGLSPISPMATGWDKPDSAAFANSALERDLKNAQVRNGQPTPPPYDDQGRDLSLDMLESASKRRRAREYKTAAASLSPDLDEAPHERAKRAKFLERNRLAASKCRQKKKEHTQLLEFNFKEQSEKKEKLIGEIARLRSEILGLKNEVLKHAQCGDEPIKLHLAQMVKKITDNDAPPAGTLPDSPVRIPDNNPSVSPLEPNPAPVTTAAPVSVPAAPATMSFGFDDPLQLEPAAAAAAEAFEQQMRRESEASLVSEGSYSFSAEDTFDDLINV